MADSIMRHEIVEGPGTWEMPLAHSVFVPFHNHWGRNSYFLHDPFDLNIHTLPAASTSGSPAAASGGRMGGFLTNGPGRVSCDGKTVVFHIPEGQKLVAIEGGSEREQWAHYNSLVEADAPGPVPVQAFWRAPEYVTWVEQKAVAAQSGRRPNQCLNEEFVQEYVKRVRKLALQKGKLTIDDGWQRMDERGISDGYWKPNEQAFPDFAGMCHWIEDRGFTPALWFGLPRAHRDAPIVRERPELFSLGAQHAGEEETPIHGALVYHKPGKELTDFYREVFEPYVKMGFRKFKLDFYYGPRKLMIELIRCAHTAIRGLHPSVEIESHHPDVFFSRWIDAARANDVNVQNGWNWQGLTLAHLRVCELCAPDKLLNIDHIGGNDPSIGEEDFIRHLRLFDVYEGFNGYPVISLLPDRYSLRAVDSLCAFLERCSGQRCRRR